MKKTIYKSPLGLLEICASDEHIVSIRFVEDNVSAISDCSELLHDAVTQLDEYFNGTRFQFDLPIKQEGTTFQQAAWSYLQTIPYGTTVSYKTEATAIGNSKAYRAAGSANGKNKVVIVVPCHRVINENKSLGGYAYGLDIKKELLRMEERNQKK